MPVRFLERDVQVAALLGYAAESADGNGRLVLVEGEPGVGKSTLLERLSERLPDARWCWGHCDGVATPTALAPLHDIAAALGGPLADACRAGADRDVQFTLLLDALRDSPTPVVLAVEDVHWADEATLDLLRYLGRRLRGTRALVLVSYRDEALAGSDPLRVAIGDLATQRSTRRVGLPPLTVEAVELLVDGTGLDPVEVHRLTGGNPFFLAELLKTPGDHLPLSARDAVLARVATLSPAARTLVEAAALVGQHVDQELVASLVDAPGSAYDELVERGLLVAHGRAWQFRHEIARRAVADSVPPRRTVEWHARILAALEQGGGDDARLAFHAEGADDAAAVLRHAPLAARTAARLSAHREAALQYRRALRFADAADLHVRATLLEGLSAECAILDHWEEALDLRQDALHTWREVGDELRAGDSLRLMSRVLWRLCRGAEGIRAIEQAVAALEPLGATTELARAYVDLAGTRMTNSIYPEAIEMARRGAILAEQFGLADVLSEALDTEACALAGLGLEWQSVMRRSLRLAVDGGHDTAAGRAYTNYYTLLLEELRIAEGERVFLDGRAFCEDHDVAVFDHCLVGERVGALELTGRWDEALTLARSYLAGTDLSPINRLGFQLATGRILARRGDPAAADVIDEGIANAERLGEGQFLLPMLLARAETLWLADREDEAAEVVRRAIDLEPAACRSRAPEAALWALRLGIKHPPLTDVLVPYRAQLAGDVSEAVAAWEAVPSPYAAALALVDSPDKSDWRDALERLDAIGATAAAALVRRRLRRAGARVPQGARASTRAHPLGLTRREQEVLDLVGAGRTDEQIAHELVISVRTAGHHVSAVLAKLGVAGRREAADKLASLTATPGADPALVSAGEHG